MLTKYRIIALIKGIVIANLVLRGLTRLLAQESIKDLKNVFFSDSIIIKLDNECALDEACQEVNTRESLRSWGNRSQRSGNYDY
jgi:hypothetical protein